ncbi:peptide chain release factor N(5)-glutamine methyltransferase [Natronohydrobacter thiooxidans]|uniref:peptide chain release factor N(5)-glutamine methyltransferase n=1 Tax=Natronohydrobacter thiooxidans TaxID=87172 RepID=UPI0008FF187A|nr:peptide chain release factor N(5)-glutamine methyltransferase [Natronohydrobacter thiooxidans]
MQAQVLLAEGVAALRAAGIEGAARDARWLMAHALDLGLDRLTLALQDPVTEAQAARFQAAIAARAHRQPVAQITGQRLFWGRLFRVTPDVLDPRPETETLIATALEQPFGRVLDLGTGSGAILATLLAECPEATGTGVDLSPAALGVAQGNAQVLGVAPRVSFLHSDWCAGVSGQFDLIVSNPPYIGAGEIADLAPETRDWEPRMALVPEGCDGTGLAAYRAIAAQAPAHLAPGGRLIVELGLGQGPAVLALFAQAGLTSGRLVDDLTGRARVALAYSP